MTMLTEEKVVVFDLDDTLFKEVEFLKSAYRNIALLIEKESPVTRNVLYDKMLGWYRNKENVFECLLHNYPYLSYSLNDLIQQYRNHFPDIKLPKNSSTVLKTLSKTPHIKLGLITDGRSIQQWNKIRALGLDDYISSDYIIVSEEFGTEKPNMKNYMFFMAQFGNDAHYYYIGDNLKKDFVTPNQLGWTTICLLDNGTNIHSQDITVPDTHMAAYDVRTLDEVILLIE